MKAILISGKMDPIPDFEPIEFEEETTRQLERTTPSTHPGSVFVVYGARIEDDEGNEVAIIANTCAVSTGDTYRLTFFVQPLTDNEIDALIGIAQYGDRQAQIEAVAAIREIAQQLNRYREHPEVSDAIDRARKAL